jgi:hypothetical protein
MAAISIAAGQGTGRIILSGISDFQLMLRIENGAKSTLPRHRSLTPGPGNGSGLCPNSLNVVPTQTAPHAVSLMIQAAIAILDEQSF